MLNECPHNLKQKKCFLRFVRNSNEIKTKTLTIDNDGVVEFNEKIEMKTTIEVDPSSKSKKSKLASLQAVVIDGGQEITLGETELDLADYIKPDKYLKQFTLK
jgi:hypothetical protein